MPPPQSLCGLPSRLARRTPTETFTYGYGRVEDLAGIAIVMIILFSAIVAGYEAIDRIFHPRTITYADVGWNRRPHWLYRQ